MAAVQRKDGTKRFSIMVYYCISYSGELSSENETIPEWVRIDDLDSYRLPDVKEIVMDGLKLISSG